MADTNLLQTFCLGAYFTRGNFYSVVVKLSKPRTSVADYSSREETKLHKEDLKAKCNVLLLEAGQSAICN